MNYKNSLLALLSIIVFSCKNDKKMNGGDFNNQELQIENQKLMLIINAKVLIDDVFEVYYYEKGQETFKSKDFISKHVIGDQKAQNISFLIPDGVYPERLRLDFGKTPTQKEIKLNYVKLVFNNKEYVFSDEEIKNEFKPSKFIDFDTEKMIILCKEIDGRYDPYFYSKKVGNIVNYLMEY